MTLQFKNRKTFDYIKYIITLNQAESHKSNV